MVLPIVAVYGCLSIATVVASNFGVGVAAAAVTSHSRLLRERLMLIVLFLF